MSDIQGKVFNDFEVPTTSDGSYRGRKKIVEATKEHFDMKLEQALAEVNQRLRSSKAKVKLEMTKGAIQLRATLPLKPGDFHKQGRDRKQYKISLAIPANFDGLKTAEEEAYELGKLIARKTFIWTDKYLGVQAQKKENITFKEFYEQFEEIYFSTRKRTIRSENTFRITKNRCHKYFSANEVITANTIKLIINNINTPANRRHGVVIARIIARYLDIELDLSNIDLKYKPKQRKIPTDKEIVDSINKIDDYINSLTINKTRATQSANRTKLVYGLIAIYGLRPREIFNQPDLDWLISPENKNNTFKVHESNKTGYREVFPFVPEWIEILDLRNSVNIKLLKEYCYYTEANTTISARVSRLSWFFSKYKIPFTPYDLRHACAIRAHLQGIPIKAAADNLGHTVEMHTKVYQRWFGLENRKKAFEQTFSEQNQLQCVLDENAKLRKRVAELELEVTRLRLTNQAISNK